MDEFRSRLRKAMFHNFLTQEKFAELIGCNQCSVSAWLTGKTVPKADVLIAMCKALNVSADWLLGLDGGKDECH